MEEENGIDKYMREAIWDPRAITPTQIESLHKTLKDESPWTQVLDDEELAEREAKMWTKVIDGWHFSLLEFPIEGQGFPTGTRVHNIAMCFMGGSHPVALMSDSPQQHNLASWIFERMKVK